MRTFPGALIKENQCGADEIDFHVKFDQSSQRRPEKRISHFITDVSLESKTGIFDDFTKKNLILSIFDVYL